MPAPENLLVTGLFNSVGQNYSPARVASVSWAPYRGACRSDYAGIRVYRVDEVPSIFNTIEVTDGPTRASSLVLTTDDFSHSGTLSPSTNYKIVARAEDAAGNVSRWSNAVEVSPAIATGSTANSAYSVNFAPYNIESTPQFADYNNFADPNWSSDAPSLSFSISTSSLQVGFGNYLSGTQGRFRIYKQNNAGGSTTTTLFKSVPGDEIQVPVAGWQRDPNTTYYHDVPAPLTAADCDPAVSLVASRVSLDGVESDRSAPVNLARRASVGAAVQPDGDIIVNWSTLPVCSGISATYLVYRQAAGCWIPDPNSSSEVTRLTPTPISATSFTDVDPGGIGGPAGPSGSGPGPTPVLIYPGTSGLPGANFPNTTPLLRWQPVTGADKYGVKIAKLTSSGDWNEVYDSESSTTLQSSSLPVPAGELLDGEQYRWKVRAHVGGSWNGYSGHLYFTVALAPQSYVYRVRVLRAGDDPSIDWPVPESYGCALLNSAALGGAAAPLGVDSAVATLQNGTMSAPRVVGQYAGAKDIFFYHHDHLGSPVVVTGFDGRVVSKQKYFPFGEEYGGGGGTLTHRFTGHERDPESGLDYMMARYYSAASGRFMSVDPGGDTDLLDPQSWNRYTYVRNNPIGRRDPDGRAAQDDKNAQRAVQGATLHVAREASTNSAVRADYARESGKLAPNDAAGRTALKSAAREASTTTGSAAAEAMRPAAGEAARAGGTASKTNAAVDAVMEGAGKAGPALFVAGAAVSAYNIASAPEGQKMQATAQEAGAWAGALGGGALGAKGGALAGTAIGGPVGGVVGAVVGGLGGSIGGAILGAKAAGAAYKAVTGD